LFLSLRANLRKVSEDIALDDLRALLGVPAGALTRWFDMRRFVLDRAIAEINHLAGFHAAYEPIKRGRRIVGVRLAWGLKARADLVAAQKEMDRPRIGRTARRAGLVETIADERHRLAESLANAPGLVWTR
jgi:plasmid replication initiation protein